MSEPGADVVIAKIIEDISGRRGLGDEWESIDVDIRNEIVAEWRTFFQPAAPLQQETDKDGELLSCPFCNEADFDDWGLKMHLTREGWCEKFENMVAALPRRTE